MLTFCSTYRAPHACMSQMQKERQQLANRTIVADPDEAGAELARLSRLSLPKLRTAWTERLGSTPPAIRSSGLVLRMLAWQIQERAFGSLDAATRRTLYNIATAIERDGDYEPKTRHDLSPGVDLTREWKGVVYKVTVTDEGFILSDKKYKSLSEAARAITGTRWSGPRFFGLEQKSVKRIQRDSL